MSHLSNFPSPPSVPHARDAPKRQPPGDRPVRGDSYIKSASAEQRKVSGMRRAGSMADTTLPSFIDAAAALAPLVQASVEESERSRRLPTPLVEAMAQSGLFRLWIPRGIGGEEADPMTLVRVVEEISRADGAAGWCMAIAGGYGAFGGYLQKEAALEIYGSDPLVRAAGGLRPSGNAMVVDGGYRVTGRWPLGSGCQHSAWIVGGCRILDGDQPRLTADGTPVTRILFFPAAECEILDTWHSIGLRGTGSHDYAVADAFVPSARSLSFREPPTEAGPLYAMPTIALFAAVLAAVPLGIARHAIDIVRELARTKIASRSRRSLTEDATMQANLGIAEAALRSPRARHPCGRPARHPGVAQLSNGRSGIPGSGHASEPPVVHGRSQLRYLGAS